jgi:Tol biopolymer transport system component
MSSHRFPTRLAALICALALLLAIPLAAAPAHLDVVFSTDQSSTEMKGYRPGADAPVDLALGELVGDGVVSPDGSHIAFLQIAGDDIALVVARPDGSDRKQLIALPAILAPAWGGDGRTLVFMAGKPVAGGMRLHTIQSDGSGHREIPVAPLPGMAQPQILFRPHLSRDAKKVLVTTLTARNPRLVEVDLLSGKDRWGVDGFDGAWSPDGRLLAFVTSPARGESAIMLADASGKGARAVASGRAFSPVWSHDGKRLHFNVLKDDELTVWSVGRDGQNPRQVAAIPSGSLLSASSKAMMLTLMEDRAKKEKGAR